MLKKIMLIGTAITLMLSFTACSTSKSSTATNRGTPSQYTDSYATDQIALSEEGGEFKNDAMASPEAPPAASPDASPTSVDQISRKVIFNSSFELQTKEYDKTIEALNLQIEKTKSYIEYSSTSGDKEKGNASANFTVRVPSAEYEAFKLAVHDLGNVISSYEGGEDVTGDYFDKDARLSVLTAQEKRVLELLDKATVIEDILKIEAELTRIRGEIEQLTTVIKRYDDLISYSTVTVNIYQTSDYVNTDDGFFAQIINTIKNSLQSGLNLLQNIVYGIVWILPYAIILAIIALIVKAILKKKNIKLFKKSAKAEELPQDETKVSK